MLKWKSPKKKAEPIQYASSRPALTYDWEEKQSHLPHNELKMPQKKRMNDEKWKHNSLLVKTGILASPHRQKPADIFTKIAPIDS